MADLYWLTFRLQKDASWPHRYNSLKDAVSSCSAGLRWWIEPTSFILFRSALGIDQIAVQIAKTIDLESDVVLLAMTDYKAARVIGEVTDEDLFNLWPDAKRF